MVDVDRVRRLLGMLERYRGLLAQDDPEPYRRRHLVQTAAQISIDLAHHVIAAEGHRTPRDHGDTFRVRDGRREDEGLPETFLHDVDPRACSPTAPIPSLMILASAPSRSPERHHGAVATITA